MGINDKKIYKFDDFNKRYDKNRTLATLPRITLNQHDPDLDKGDIWSDDNEVETREYRFTDNDGLYSISRPAFVITSDDKLKFKVHKFTHEGSIKAQVDNEMCGDFYFKLYSDKLMGHVLLHYFNDDLKIHKFFEDERIDKHPATLELKDSSQPLDDFIKRAGHNSLYDGFNSGDFFLELCSMTLNTH